MSTHDGPLVLVVSVSQDDPHVAPVQAALQDDHTFVRVDLDRVAAGTQRLDLVWEAGEAVLHVDGRRFFSGEIAAGWWRKPHWLTLPVPDPLLNQSLVRENLNSNAMVWSFLDSRIWLNDPWVMNGAAQKGKQWRIAESLGLRTARTVVGNQWTSVTAALGNTPTIFKAVDGSLRTQEGGRATYATKLDPVALNHLSQRASAWPGMFQESLTKSCEWRVTVVGSETFPVAVRATGAGLTDWRKSRADEVQFSSEPLSANVAAACVALTHQLGLRYSAIDLVVDSGGEFWFLEANPNGQFAWLDPVAGGQISAAIAACLSNIAFSRG